MQTEINEKNLLESGYKEYKTSYGGASKGFQKTVRDKFEHESKLYFINVEEFDFSESDNYPLKQKLKYQAEVHFFHQTAYNNEQWFIVKASFNYIEEMEVFYNNLYKTLKCIPDIHNN